MGRFVTKKLAYQQHEIDEKKYETKRYWIEYVVPRKSTYKGRILVIVGHWTGSMGEGMALGFDRMKRAKLIGTRMAGLIGAISQFEMTQTKIRFQIPTERLYHINGTPREDFVPDKLTSDIYQTWTFLNKKLGNIVP
jgi:C-terminal processing protease CtpA/Prc